MSKPTHISEGAVARADSPCPSIDLHIALRDAYDRQRFAIVAANKLIDAGLVAGMPADDAFEAMMWAWGWPDSGLRGQLDRRGDERLPLPALGVPDGVRRAPAKGLRGGEVLDPVLAMPGVGKPGTSWSTSWLGLWPGASWGRRTSFRSARRRCR